MTWRNRSDFSLAPLNSRKVRTIRMARNAFLTKVSGQERSHGEVLLHEGRVEIGQGWLKLVKRKATGALVAMQAKIGAPHMAVSTEACLIIASKLTHPSCNVRISRIISRFLGSPPRTKASNNPAATRKMSNQFLGSSDCSVQSRCVEGDEKSGLQRGGTQQNTWQNVSWCKTMHWI